MVKEPTLVAAAAGGLVSIVVNIISVGVQYWLNKRGTRREHRDQWYRDIISDVKEIRRTAMLIDPDTTLEISSGGSPTTKQNSGQINVLEDLIRQVERRKDNIPPELANSRIDSELSRLVSSYREIGLDNDDPDIFHLKESVIQKSESLLDTVERKYERADDLY